MIGMRIAGQSIITARVIPIIQRINSTATLPRTDRFGEPV